MPTNLNIDDDLLDETLAASGKKTKREAVNIALSEFVQRRKQKKVLELFGKLDWSPNYDHKKERERS
jgi:Arc/MetJ family transcription regulator